MAKLRLVTDGAPPNKRLVPTARRASRRGAPQHTRGR